MKGFYKILKRLIDIVGSIVALIVFFPISVIIALRIKMEDGGPVLYQQNRVGKNGKVFSMWKFRSMIVGAHAMKKNIADMNEVDGPIFKIKDDPRITKVGKYIRAHSLDEIPQFINVLQGTMSLVGPRPALPEEVEEYSGAAMQRLTVKPGITGLWQVSGRSNLTYELMIKLDLTYVREATILLDLKILIMTLIQMFFPGKSGAY
ncbi:sugar transferase [Weissella confusa]|uniref:sugar transferase n=1 Tax=Weissella confusa TaxID=1583 RepID=UPI002A756017|nr:sugar transferase [Weissella confusa]MDY2513078.1 sugar transferase [Weissella confusa]